MKSNRDLHLELLSKLDDDIIERNTEKRFALLEKHSAPAPKKSGKRVRLLLLAAVLALLVIGSAVAIPLLLREDPAIVTVERTGTDGSAVIYTITYEDGTTATFSVLNEGTEGISDLTANDAGDLFLQLTSGNAISLGNRIGLLSTGTTPDTVVTGAKMNADGHLSLGLANDRELALGKPHGGNGMSLSAVQIDGNGNLIVGFATGETVNLGRVVGKDGQDGVGIDGIAINENGELTVTLTNGTVINLGNVKGADGIGISESKINDEGELCLTYTDGHTVNLGRVVGEKGEDGVGIATITITENSELVITLTDGTGIHLGNIKGENGKSAYELYCEKFGYEGTEEEWLFDLVNGNLAAKIEYTVTFDSAGGSPVLPQTVWEGGKVIEPSKPTRAGYLFLGWYYGEELWSFGGHSVTESMTLTARWEAIQYFVTETTFDLQGGSFTWMSSYQDPDSEKTVYGFEYSYDTGLTYSIPTKEGYRFLGWTWTGQSTPQKGSLSVKLLSESDGRYNGGSIGQHPGVLRATLAIQYEAMPSMTAHWSPIRLDLLPVSGTLVHQSFAIGAAEGSDVCAMATGTVVYCGASDNGLYSNTRITILTDDGYAYMLAGMTNTGWKVGDRIQKGDVIGQIVLSDTSTPLAANGTVTVPHCYVAIAHYHWTNGAPNRVTWSDPVDCFTPDCLAALGYQA
ncbi:MAG: InlB B-repeat-containing protein [Clostridia bacterium]|nr:InlB B-repeat-containing protein [Clostridia bacterium]